MSTAALQIRATSASKVRSKFVIVLDRANVLSVENLSCMVDLTV